MPRPCLSHIQQSLLCLLEEVLLVLKTGSIPSALVSNSEHHNTNQWLSSSLKHTLGHHTKLGVYARALIWAAAECRQSASRHGQWAAGKMGLQCQLCHPDSHLQLHTDAGPGQPVLNPSWRHIQSWTASTGFSISASYIAQRLLDLQCSATSKLVVCRILRFGTSPSCMLPHCQ